MASTNYVPRSMRNKIIIERGSVSRNATGEEVPTWGTLTSAWADIGYGPATENISANKETIHQTVTFTIRKPGNIVITERDRIKHNNYYFNIISIQPLGENHYLKVITSFLK